uniref:Uncharacterized protein n=1 Tax=Arundo donax TaxID=35708 RepID=A0A0A9AJ80_ARUDO
MDDSWFNFIYRCKMKLPITRKAKFR